ncbi:MAG: sel1 repeat family protein [Deltaproteobacteria bacterium]|nr:MAG: sel1 repeat family protein [Deltaproteobacteria bacterium]
MAEGPAPPDPVESSADPASGVAPTAEVPSDLVLHYREAGEVEAELAGDCEAGDARACRLLGDLARHGRVSDGLRLVLEAEPSPARAIQLYQRGCFANDPWACLEMARMYADGVLVPESAEMAASLRHSARAGLFEACATGELASCVGQGILDVLQGDVEEGVRTWRASCGQGTLEACAWLVVQDEADAEEQGLLVRLCTEAPRWPACAVLPREMQPVDAWRQRCDDAAEADACRLLVARGEPEDTPARRTMACGASDGCPEPEPDRFSLEGWGP